MSQLHDPHPDTPIVSRHSTADYLDAVKLALQAGTDSDSKAKLVGKVIEAAETDVEFGEGAQVLVDAIVAARAKVTMA